MKRKITRQYTKVKDTVKYFNKNYTHIDDEVKRRKYKFLKTYEHFVLLERLDNGCKECFHHGEYNQLEVVD